ncbi:GFA family protein [Legionella spiritensis]|uniref:Glutathione-dependent formaldehyde-activating enzyme n=1 Tax=Legionella spiritensis TaxID=452 RepID=A0A0W0YXH5_LEGSP|nr:GFA family protein [Legionella spiritensis]KTD61570.1 Glutathione-dependent formaldehyde-activating enzyme [Legionella spiritensis]SNV32417.1 Uncharacterized conserved protein [Legionella spiritensis]
MTMQGGCLCGAVRFQLKGTVNGFYFCHCSRCQKSSGSAHASNLFVSNGTLVWEQGENVCADYEHEGTRFSKRFCKRCACPLPRIIDDKNKLIQVPAGSLDGDQYFKPTAHIFMESKKCWEDELSQTQRFPGLPE